MRLGGKASLSPAARLLLKARESRKRESLAPLTDNLAGGVQTGSYDIIRETFAGKEDDLGANNITIR